MDFTNKTILITGASQGLGRSLALQFAEQGTKLALVARNLKSLEALRSEINGRFGSGKTFIIPADISDKRAIYPLIAQTTELAGPIDILIHNASALGPVPLRILLDTECEELEYVVATNLLGPFRLSKAVLGPMLLRKRGLIINISSDAATNDYPTWGPYSVTKSATDHLTRIWAKELEDSPIQFLSIDPGEMNTLMHEAAIPNADKSSLASPDQVAQSILLMIEQSSKFSSGTRIITSEWRQAYESSKKS